MIEKPEKEKNMGGWKKGTEGNNVGKEKHTKNKHIKWRLLEDFVMFYSLPKCSEKIRILFITFLKLFGKRGKTLLVCMLFFFHCFDFESPQKFDKKI